MLQASYKMCIQSFCFLKNILLIKNLGTYKDKTSADFIVASEKHFKTLWVWTSTLQPPFPTMCTILAEKITKSSVAISPHFPIISR